MQLGSAIRDINDYRYARGVLPGCPEIARIVSFTTDIRDGYIAMDPVSIDAEFQTTMKVKTREKDGLVFYVTDDGQVSLHN